MLVMLFSSWTVAAVGDTAQAVVEEVRRQFRVFPGIMSKQQKPDYKACVSIVTRASLRKMIKPGMLAVLFPLVLGVVFRTIGEYLGDALLGAKAVLSLQIFATVSGILMSLFFNNSGGAWDNSKKLIETGLYGGKGSEAHKAAVTGDTVGDPFKDTAGPSLHVLIKLLSTVTLVMCPLFVGRVAAGV
jgi:Na+/H+-translocating membrane pyrophosphatase